MVVAFEIRYFFGTTFFTLIVPRFVCSCENVVFHNSKKPVKAKTKINRKDFGLTWSQAVEVGPVVGDQVEITLNIQAALAK